MKTAASLPTLRIKIHSPFVVYFDGDATSVSALNQTGPFDILPEHHKFLTVLSPGDVTVRLQNGKLQKFAINSGIMHVKSDQATVFLDV